MQHLLLLRRRRHTWPNGNFLVFPFNGIPFPYTTMTMRSIQRNILPYPWGRIPFPFKLHYPTVYHHRRFIHHTNITIVVPMIHSDPPVTNTFVFNINSWQPFIYHPPPPPPRTIQRPPPYNPTTRPYGMFGLRLVPIRLVSLVNLSRVWYNPWQWNYGTHPYSFLRRVSLCLVHVWRIHNYSWMVHHPAVVVTAVMETIITNKSLRCT